MPKFGGHTDISEDVIESLKIEGLNCLQYMPGGELSYTPGHQYSKILLAYDNDINVVFHAPLVCYCVAEKPAVISRTIAYLVQLDNQVEYVKRARHITRQFCVVVHCGSLNDLSTEARTAALTSFCGKFLSKTKNLVLCIENDIGSKKGTRVGSVSFLYNFVHNFNSPRVKLCIDTNHSWGHEKEDFDVTSMSDWDRIISEVRVIHYNCIPSICPRYGHKDRHSDDLIENSGEATSWLLNLYRKNYNCFYITERRDLELSIKDYQWVRSQII